MTKPDLVSVPPGRARWWRWLDVAVAVALLVGLTGPVLLGNRSHDDPWSVVAAFGAAAALPIAVRGRYPVAALTTIVAAMTVASLLGVQITPFGSNASPAVGLAMYTVTVRLARRNSLALVAVVAVTFTSAWIATWTQSADENAVHVVAALAGWFAGESVRTRRSYRAELAARRQQEAEERTRRAVAEERLQISREVHDVVSHNLAVIAVRSGVGRMLFDSQPEAARGALREIETVSRSALTELRRVLGAIRDHEPLAPAPGIDDLPDLVAQVSATGPRVTLDQRGDPAALPPTLDSTAYRIVQEALTNVVKHAGPTRVEVLVDVGGAELRIEVADEGPADGAEDQAVGREGWGLIGIRERAALFGGTVEAGPRHHGTVLAGPRRNAAVEAGSRRHRGFQLSVRIPVTGKDSER